jgi:uncharacterized membrane protein
MITVLVVMAGVFVLALLMSALLARRTGVRALLGLPALLIARQVLFARAEPATELAARVTDLTVNTLFSSPALAGWTLGCLIGLWTRHRRQRPA